ncbi:MAG TPA: hypothetical protein DCM08_11085 [Microscillaceae bacterium]|nr:hypothetical protein [Microscillaceae bacterium]
METLDQVIFTKIFKIAPEPIFITNLSGIFLFVNASMAKLLGIDNADDLIGQSEYDYLPEENKYFLTEKLLEIKQNPHTIQTILKKMKAQDGRIVEVESVATGIVSGNLIYRVVFARDMHLRRSLEYALDLREKNLRQISYLNSHVIRKPVATILGLISIIDKANLADPHNAELLSLLEKTVHELDSIIHQINQNTQA